MDERGSVFCASFKGEGWQLGVGKGGTSTRSVVLTENPSHPNAYPLRGMMKSGRQWLTHEKLIDPIHKYQAEAPGSI